jgi:hypothetical protein
MKAKKITKQTNKAVEMPRVRGLLWSEYRRLERRITLGELTWTQAEELGLCLPRAKSGRKRIALASPSQPTKKPKR